jgi:sortase A
MWIIKAIKLKTIGILLVVGGAFTLMSSGALWLGNYYDEKDARDYSDTVAAAFLDNVEQNRGTDADPPAGDTQDEDEPLAFLPLEESAYMGVLTIPALELTIPVNASLSMPALKRTPCRYSGTLADDTLVIAAHNYRSHFRGISRLEPSDDLAISDALGQEYKYKVALLETVAPTSVDYVKNSGYDLTLFTCTYGGQARVVLRCVRVG